MWICVKIAAGVNGGRTVSPLDAASVASRRLSGAHAATATVR